MRVQEFTDKQTTCLHWPEISVSPLDTRRVFSQSAVSNDRMEKAREFKDFISLDIMTLSTYVTRKTQPRTARHGESRNF